MTGVPLAPGTTARPRPGGAARPWIASALLGALGFAVNLVPFDVAFGLDIIMGGVFGLLAWRLYGLGPGMLAAGVAGAATYVLWGHPYAALVLVCEIPVLAMLARRGIPMMVGAGGYWLFGGAPLLWLTYGHILGMDEVSLYLVIVKQSINGLVHVLLAETLLVALAVVPAGARLARQPPSLPLRDILLFALVGFAAIPVIAVAVFKAQRDFEQVTAQSAHEVREAGRSLSSALRLYTEDVLATVVSTVRNPDAEPVRPDLAAFEIRGADGAILRRWSNPAAAGDSVKLIVDHPVPVSGQDEVAVSVWGARKRIEGIIGQNRRLHQPDVALIEPDGGTMIGSVSPAPTTNGPGTVEVAPGIFRILPEMPGKSLMMRWKRATFTGAFPLAFPKGWTAVASFSPGDLIVRYREAQLIPFSFLLGFLLLTPLVAFPLSGAVSARLNVLATRFRAMSGSNAAASPEPLPETMIHELKELTAEFESMAAALAAEKETTRAYQNELEASERRLRAILENSGDAILTLDPRGRVNSANPMAAEVFGYGQGAFTGMPVHKLLPDFPFSRAHDGPGAEPARLERGELPGVRRNGEKFSAEFVMSTVEMGGGGFHVLGIRDTSEKRAMQEQLIQTSKLSTLGEMAAGMAHELNQPLSVMRMAADNALLRMERNRADPDYLKETLELISDQSGKMGGTVLNLRTFARREASSGQDRFSPAVAVGAACQLMHGGLRLGSIALDTELPESGRLVRGDGTQLEQVIINLLANARDAILARRRNAADMRDDRIVVRLREVAGEPPKIRITVEDTGGGIPPDVLPDIFNPFFTTKEVGQGTGLGLSISYGIVTEMGGTIEAGNVSGGARFTVTLPVLGGGAAGGTPPGPA